MRGFNYFLIAVLSVSYVVIEPTALLAASASDYRALGLAYRNQGRFSDAIAALKKAVELDSQSLPGRVSLGWTLHLADQDREAAEVLQQAAALDVSNVPTFNALGIVYLVNDDLVSAALVHNWAILLSPNNEIAYYNLSLTYQRMQQYRWAIASAKTATVLEPDNPHPLIALAIAHWQNQEQAIAQQVYQQAIRLDTRYENSTFLPRLSTAGFSTPQIEQSRQILEAVRSRPE